MSKKTTPAILRDKTLFPIMPWDPFHVVGRSKLDAKALLTGIKESNCNVVGFVAPEHVRICEELGLYAFLMLKGRPRDWRACTEEQIGEIIRRNVASTGSSKSVVGYYVHDEPNVDQYPALRKVVEALRRHAPGKLAYLNLFPNHAVKAGDGSNLLGPRCDYREYVARFLAEVRPDFLSWDNYMVQYSMDMTRKKEAIKYLDNILVIRDFAMKHRIPFWNVTIACQIRPHTTVPSYANLQLQAYTTLAAGAQGLGWYRMLPAHYHYGPFANGGGERTQTWYFLGEINRQVSVLGPIMRKLTSTGIFFAGPPIDSRFPVLPGRLLRSVECRESLMVGEFKGRGADYAMIVNLSATRSAKISVRFKAGHRMRPISSVTGKLENPQANRAMWGQRDEWLTAGEGRLFRVSPGPSAESERRSSRRA